MYDPKFSIDVKMALSPPRSKGDKYAIRGLALEELVRRNITYQLIDDPTKTSSPVVRLIGSKKPLQEYLDQVYDPNRFGDYHIKPIPDEAKTR